MANSKSGELLNKVLNWIATIVMLKKGDIELKKGGLFVSGPWGESMPVGILADGHQAIITLVSDLLGWSLLYDETIFEKELSGIVIIDEIEQHLHPKWQRKIVALFKEVFPKIQFVSSKVLEQLPPGEIPVRFVVTRTDSNGYQCELGILSGTDKFLAGYKHKFSIPVHEKSVTH